VSDWTPHLDQLVQTVKNLLSAKSWHEYKPFLGISEEPKGALYEFLWSCLYPPKGLATSPTRSILSRVFTKVPLMCLKSRLRPSHPKKEPELGGKERQPWRSTRQPDLETMQRIDKWSENRKKMFYPLLAWLDYSPKHKE
jgi:hypothetical protein